MTIKDQAEDLIDGIKENLTESAAIMKNCDGIQIDDRIAEKAKEIIKRTKAKDLSLTVFLVKLFHESFLFSQLQLFFLHNTDSTLILGV